METRSSAGGPAVAFAGTTFPALLLSVQHMSGLDAPHVPIVASSCPNDGGCLGAREFARHMLQARFLAPLLLVTSTGFVPLVSSVTHIIV